MRLVATWVRWAMGVCALAAVFVLAVEAFVTFTRSGRSLGSFAGLILGFLVVDAALVYAALRSEEARLTRELRMARTGTAALRNLVLGRRQQTPIFARLFSTKLGTAALLLAEGDRQGALDSTAGGSLLMRGGRLDRVRAVIEADAERASGTSVGLERCVAQLRSMPLTGHREADLYRTHVYAKALLEQGDPEGAFELARRLEGSADEDERVYAVWLRVWFNLDVEAPGAESWQPLDPGELRMAILLARSHGATALVELLEARIGSVARDDVQ